jgi:cytochrome c biogenesis protein CcmG, thiol:disulfide interchange protein DsbE
MTRREKVILGFCFAALIGAVGSFAIRRSRAQSTVTASAAPAPVNVSPDVRTLLDQVRQAYTSLPALSISGTFQGNLDIDGVHRYNVAQFSGLYSSNGLFRHETKQTISADPATTEPTTQPASDTVLGNNGSNIYLFFPLRNRYQMIEAPKGKINLDSLGEDVADILRNQNLSLALAISGDAETELLQDATSISRVEDVKIEGQAYPTIQIIHPLFDQTLVIDPQTHLLRRMIGDVSKNAVMKGAKVVKSALLTSDYVNSTSAALPAAQFAWTPPADAQELTPVNPDADLTGKPAPSFSLAGMDGKPVTDQTLKGSIYVLDFWATWCPPCIASLPIVDAVHKDYKDKGVKFFAVNVQEDKATIDKFVSDTKLSIPVLMDTEGKVEDAFDPLGVTPFTVIVGKDGKVRFAAPMIGLKDRLPAMLDQALKP